MSNFNDRVFMKSEHSVNFLSEVYRQFGTRLYCLCKETQFEIYDKNVFSE